MGELFFAAASRHALALEELCGDVQREDVF